MILTLMPTEKRSSHMACMDGYVNGLIAVCRKHRMRSMNCLSRINSRLFNELIKQHLSNTRLLILWHLQDTLRPILEVV